MGTSSGIAPLVADSLNPDRLALAVRAWQQTRMPWPLSVLRSKSMNLSAQGKVGFTAGRPHPVGPVADTWQATTVLRRVADFGTVQHGWRCVQRVGLRNQAICNRSCCFNTSCN